MRNVMFNIIKLSKRTFVTNSLRCKTNNIFYHKSKPTSYKDTLQYWIINKFREEDKYVSLRLEDTSIDSKAAVKALSNKDLLNYWLSTKTNKTVPLLNSSESELISRLKTAKFDEVITILDASLSFYDHKLTNSDIYKISLSRLEYLSNIGQYDSVYHNIQCLYFCSLLKKSKSSEKLMLTLVNNICDSLEGLNNIELSIVCISLFKCSLKPSSNLTNVLTGRMTKDFDWFIDNPSLMTCFIKSLRHARVYNDSLFDLFINNYDKVRKIDVISKIHLLVYFCDSLHSNVNFIEGFIRDILKEISNMFEKDEFVRYKDVDNLLWSCSNYWHANIKEMFNEYNLSLIINKVIDKESTSLSEKFNTLYYLRILNERNDYLMSTLNRNNVLSVKRINNFKDLARLSTLITCVSIEEPTLLKNDMLELRETRLQPKLKKYFTKRPKIEKLLKEMIKNQKYLQIKNVQFGFPISCLYIGSVMCTYRSKQISFELFDESTCYRDSFEPHGNMMLKLRLLKQLGIDYCVIKNDIDVNTVENIRQWLKRK